MDTGRKLVILVGAIDILTVFISSYSHQLYNSTHVMEGKLIRRTYIWVSKLNI